MNLFARQKSMLLLWSNEYIEHVVISETVKLLNLRCLDLGYIPYNQGATGKVKLWGPPRFIRKSEKEDS